MSVDLSEFLTSADEDLMNQLRKGPAHLTGQESGAERMIGEGKRMIGKCAMILFTIGYEGKDIEAL